MPLTPEMRQSIEQIRNYLYGGGYPDPMSNAEQLSFLFFFYLIEGIDAENTMKAYSQMVMCPLYKYSGLRPLPPRRAVRSIAGIVRLPQILAV